MSNDTEALKDEVRKFLRLHMTPVPAQLATSGKKHLEVWRPVDKPRAVGLEMDHAGLIGLWLARQHVPPGLPDSITRVDKEPKLNGWTDAAGRGANSNLTSYVEFRRKKISRLAVTSLPDAMFVLEALLK